jgi:hypothetical protein
MQVRSTICAECTTGLEIILDAHDGTVDDMGHVESCFGLFGDYVNVGLLGDSAYLDSR